MHLDVQERGSELGSHGLHQSRELNKRDLYRGLEGTSGSSTPTFPL